MSDLGSEKLQLIFNHYVIFLVCFVPLFLCIFSIVFVCYHRTGEKQLIIIAWGYTVE